MACLNISNIAGLRSSKICVTSCPSLSTPRVSCVRSFEPIEYPSNILKNSSAKITVTGGGSGVGISALMEGTTDIAMTESDDEHPDEDPAVVEQVTIYAVDRTIKFNRDTHSLIRAALVAFALKDGGPAYYINCYMTKDLIASISVVPLTEKGPVFRNAARWSNRPDSNAE